MAGNVLIKNANGNTVTLQNPDTNVADVVVDTSKIVQKVTSTDKAIVRFNGVTGDVQNSSIIVTDNGSLLLTSGTGALGYRTGAGGTVTQLTSKSTTVTLNKPSGQIITHNAALVGNSVVAFSFNNSLLEIGDSIIINVSLVSYRVFVLAIGAGVCTILIENRTAGSLSDSLTLNYSIIKGVNA